MEELHGLDELNRRVLQKGLCASCGACVGRCPYLTCFKGKTVMLDSCTVQHGRCFTYCPMTFFDAEAVSRDVFGVPPEEDAIGHYREVMAARSADETIAAMGQAGGTVSSLLTLALSESFIEAVVLTGMRGQDDLPGGVVASTPEEVMACAGSRYVGAHSLAALRDALDKGYSRIGVVGLPCQVRSLRKMALYDLKQEGLKQRISLVVGLFCNWAFSSRDFAAFLATRLDLKEIGKIHIPPPPAQTLEIEGKQGLQAVPLDDVRPLIQSACAVCPDMTSDYADLSVGMYEGRDGWNTVVVRSEAGADLLKMANDKGCLETDLFPEANLGHLKRAAGNKRQRARQK